MKSTKYALLGSSSLTRPLLLLGAASAMMGGTPAQALDSNALPQGANVVGGSASVSQSGNTLNVNQSSSRAIIDWRSFNIGSQATTNFAQPNSSAIAVNRVNGSTNASQIEGTLKANGQVWILNPNGVFFGKSAVVDVAGIVATTANIDDKAFMAGSTRLQMTGGDSGSVVNQGTVTVGQGGLAAFVAPSVRNSGTIKATVGKVALAAGDTYTLDLAGDRLVEIGLGATKAVVDQSGKIVNPGGIITISAQAAGQAVDSVVNMSGVTTASSATSSGGTIILGGDDINTSASSKISADGGATGNGGTITAVANKAGTYAGSITAQGGAQGGNGGNIETSGDTVTVASNAHISASAANGAAGTWTLDPRDVTITAGTGGNLNGATVTVGTIQNDLNAGTNVKINTSSGTGGSGDIDLSASISANGSGNLELDGRHLYETNNSTISNSGTGNLVLGVNQVNPSATSSGWINDALAMVGTIGGNTTVNLGAGTYTVAPSTYILLNQNNLTLNGAGAGPGTGATTIDASSDGEAYSIRVWGNNDTLSGFNLLGSTASNGYGVKVEPSEAGTVTPNDRINNFSISNVDISGSHKNGLDLNGVEVATINGVTVTGTTAGTGIAITDSDSVTVKNSDTSGNAWGGLALYEHNAAYNLQEGNITIAASNTFNEANPIYMEDESTSKNFGSISVAGYNYIAGDQSNPNDVYTFFQNSASGAESILDATGRAAEGYVEGWNKTAGNNIFNVDVTTGGTAMSINAALRAASSGATINVGAGTFTDALDITQNVDIEGAGQNKTIIAPTTLLNTGVGHKYTSDVQAAVFVNGASDVTISGVTINANNINADAAVFWNNASGSINNSVIELTGTATLPTGIQTGQGLAVDATGANTSTLLVNNVTFQNWNKNAIDAVTGDGTGGNGGNISLDVEGSSFTGAGATSAIAQNGIVLWEQGGGNVSATVNNDTFAKLNYGGAGATAAGVLQYGSPNGTLTVSNSTFGGNVQTYISTAGGSSNNVDATNNNTFGGVTVSGATSLSDLYTVENKIIDGTDDSSNGLVRLVAGNVYVTAAKASENDLQNGIDVASSGDTINVQAGTYTDALDITKNVDIVGAGVGQTIIQPTSLVDTGVGHKYTSDVQAAVFVNGASDVNISGVTIDANNLGADAVVFWNNASGSITNALIENPMALSGVQTGQDLAVDATTGTTSTLLVSGVTFQNWNKNAIDAETGDGSGANGGNISLDVEGSSFTGAGATSTIAQNGIVLWEQGGGNVSATVNNDTFSKLNYAGGGDTAAGVLQYGSPNGTLTVTNSTFNNNVQTYISLAGGSPNDVDASTDTFAGVTAGSATLNQLYTIENKIIDGTDDATNGLVRLQAGQVYVTQAKASEDDLQNAIDVASSGDAINVQAGTYNDQIVIDGKDLTIAGAGAGQTIITSPVVLASSYNGNSAVVSIQDGADVTIKNLTVDGLGNGSGLSSFDGIGVYDSSAVINKVDVTGIRDGGVGGTLSGAQHGIGVDAINDSGTAQSVTLENSSIEDFQKNAATFKGGNLTVDVENNVITGAGNTGVIAQNGIELFGISGDGNGNVKGTISGNTITGVSYNDPANTDASGILLWNANGTTVSGNTITGTSMGATEEGSLGIYAYSSNNLNIAGNTLTNLGTGIYLDFGDANATISGGSVSGDQVGIYTAKSLSGLGVTGVSFSDNPIQFQGSQAAVTAVMNDPTNSFDKYVVNANGDTSIYGDLQLAVDDEANNSFLAVGGTFDEQVVIDHKNLTLSGFGWLGLTTATIEAPATLASSYNGNSAVLSIQDGANVTVQGFTVDGQGHGAGMTSFDGIGVYDFSATINGVFVTGMNDGPLDGAQHGIGVDAINASGKAQSVTLENSTISGFQKDGAAFKGGNLTVDVEGDGIIGAGSTGLIAQNGIELYGISGDGNGNVTGTIYGNSITGVSYNDPANTSATGILLWNANNTLVKDNSVTGANMGANEGSNGIYAYSSTGLILAGNQLTNLGTGIYLDAGDANATISSPDPTYPTRISGNQVGIYTDKGLNGLSVTGVVFSNNEIQFQGSKANVATVLADPTNTFDASVSNDAGDTNIYGDLQLAIDSEANKSVLDLAGTFNQQVLIDGKTLTLNGQGKTTIEAPSTLNSSFTTQVGFAPGTSVDAIVGVINGSKVTIEDLTVDGRNQGNTNDYFMGIGADNSSLTVDDVHVTNISNSPLSGVQSGVGIGVFNDGTTNQTATITDSFVNNFQKNGIALQGGGLKVDVEGNTVTGAGNISTIAQNGIELFGLAGVAGGTDTGTISGLVSGNYVTSVSYNDPSDYATSIYLINTNGVTVSGNVLVGEGSATGSSYGISILQSDNAKILNNDINNFQKGISIDDAIDGPYFASSGTVAINNNLINNNGTAVSIGDSSTDASTSTVTAFDNDLSGNNTSVDLELTNAAANFSGNWWGVTGANAVENSLAGDVTAVDISPFLMSGANAITSGPGFQGDFSDITVTTQGSQTGSAGRIAEGLKDVTTTALGDNGTVNVQNGAYLEDVKVTSPVNLDFGNNVSVNTLTLQGAAAGSNLSGNISAVGVDANNNGFALNGAVGLDGNLTLDTTATNGGIVIAAVDGTGAGGQNLTLKAGSGAVSLGDSGANVALGQLRDNNTTTLTGRNYDAADISINGPVTLTKNTTLEALGSLAGPGSVTLGTVDGDGTVVGGQNLTLIADYVDIGDIGNTNVLGKVQSDKNTTTLTGNSYVLGSLEINGSAVLNHGGTTVIDTSANNGDITLGAFGGVDGTSAGTQNLTLKAGSGTVSLGDIGDNFALNNVKDENTTTLTGGSYVANSLDFGALTLTNDTTLDTSANSGQITVASVDDSHAGQDSLTLNGGASTVSLGAVGANKRVGDLVANSAVELTGNEYDANSLTFNDAVTLDHNATLNTAADDGDITLVSVDGRTVGGQNLTIKAGAGTVSLGDVGDTNPLNNLTDNNTTTLTGTQYNATNITLGATTLGADLDVEIDADNANIASVDGTNGDEELFVSANTAELGNVGSNTAFDALFASANNTITLTGDTYNTNGIIALTSETQLTAANTTFSSTATGTVGGIELLSVDGTVAGANDLTINVPTDGLVLLGQLGTITSLGAVTDTNGTVALAGGLFGLSTGSSYNASSFNLGAVQLIDGTNATLDTSSDNGQITIASVDDGNGLFAIPGAPVGSLVLNAGSGNVSLGDTGAVAPLFSLSDIGSGVTTLTGDTYAADSMSFSGQVVLTAADTFLDTDNGALTTIASLDGTTAGQQSLIINPGSGPVSLGDVGANVALAAVDNASGVTTLTGDTYNAGSLNLGAVTLTAASTSLNTSEDNGAIILTSVDGTTAGDQDLSLNAGTGTVSLGDVGANVALGAISDASNTTLTGDTYEASALNFGALTLTASDTTLDTSADNGAITVASVDGTTAGGQNLTLNGGSVSLGNVGATTALGALDDANTTTLTGGTYNAGSLDFGALTLAANATLDTSANNGAITVASVNGSTAGAQNLTLKAGAGTVTLGNVGSSTRLGALSDANATTLIGGTYNAGSLNFGALTLDANTSLNTSAGNGAITVASVNGSSAGAQNLTLNAGSGTVSLGNTGASTRLGAVSDTSKTTLTGSTYNANSLNFGALTLANNTTLNTSAGNGAITVASVDGSSAGAQSLTLNAGSGTVSLGNTGATTGLGAVSDTSKTTLTGSTYNANSLNFGALTLAANTTLNTSADNGAITVASVDGSSAGAQSLALNAGSGTVSLGNVGSATRLGALTDASTTTLTGGTYNANSLTFNAPVTLTAATTTLNTTQSASAAGDITFNGAILATSNAGQNLVLTAGPGTGAASANGNIVLQNVGTSAVALNNLTVSGNNFTALTVNIAGNYASTLTGNQVFASDTLDAGGNVLANVSGNATGHIAAKGTVTENVTGTVSGTISGSSITLAAGTVTAASLTAQNNIGITAGLVSNSSLTAPNVLIVAGRVTGVTVTATNLSVSASGDIEGTWANLSASGSLTANGESAQFNKLSPQQLVVEGFNLPAGTQIAANGTLILPAGMLIGLLSPGGGEPRVVLVRTVQSLGELLSEGYVAIVIDLSGRKKDDKIQLASN